MLWCRSLGPVAFFPRRGNFMFLVDRCFFFFCLKLRAPCTIVDSFGGEENNKIPMVAASYSILARLTKNPLHDAPRKPTNVPPPSSLS